MTRKSVKFSSGPRCSWKTTLMKRACTDKDSVLNISISSSNTKRWNELKVKLSLDNDSDLVDYLLTLAETSSQLCAVPTPAEEWWPPESSRRKSNRGPTLRAVLRRSTRSAGVRRHVSLPKAPSEEVLSDTLSSCTLKRDGDLSSGFKSGLKHLCKGRSPINAVLSTSHKKQEPKNQDENEQKANQLDAELALLVETVASPSQDCAEDTEKKLYELQGPTFSESNSSPPSSKSINVKGKKILKVGCRRWKSYHKDKRKWKQSYAAVLMDAVPTEMVSQENTKIGVNDLLYSDEPEKERKIFKGLKKSRILTAYMDTQNKIAAHTVKDPPASDKEEVPDFLKENEENSELSSKQEIPKLNCESNKKTDGNTSTFSDSEDCREASSTVNIGCKSDVGKENQSAQMPVEPVFIEVGERVKLKRRKKRLSQESKEILPDLKDDDAGDYRSATDLQRQHKKRSRSRKMAHSHRSVEDQPLSKGMNFASRNSKTYASDSPSEDLNQCVKGDCAINVDLQEEQISSYNSVGTSDVLMSVSSEQLHSAPEELEEHLSAKIKSCSFCNLKHLQQICPIQNPPHKLEDSITSEQWQLRSQMQVRCTVIEAPRPKPGRARKNALESPSSTINDRKDGINTDHQREADNSCVYAEESLPIGLGFQVIDEEHGKSVISRIAIAQFTQFGPLVGPFVKEKDIFDESDMRHIWELVQGKEVLYINTDDPQKSNWLRYIRPAPLKENRNVTLIVKDTQLYFITTVDIKVGDELLFWADDHVTSWSRKKILKSSCGGCNMHFAHPLYYRTHCAVFHDPSHSLTIRKYHCKVCGEAVLGKENIMKHASDRHEGRGAYQCQYCHKFFLRLNYLEMHRTYGCASNPHRNRPLCDFCGRYFCQPQKLKVHIKRMHSDMNEVLREFQCKSCLKILGSRAALQRHFKEVHHRDVVVSSNCDRCGKSFQNRSNLKIHMLTHSGVKPFRCQQESCAAAFTTKQCLQFHYKKAHGLSEDALPRIERSIAYTFDAYAGGAVDSSSSSNSLVKKSLKGRKPSTKPQKLQTEHAMKCQTENELAQHFLVSASTVDQEVETLGEHNEQQDHVESSKREDTIPEMNGYSHSVELLQLPRAAHASAPHKAEADTSGRSPPPAGVLLGLHYGHEEKSVYSNKALTPLMVTSDCYSPVMPGDSPSLSPTPPRSRSASPSRGLRSMISMGRKKWLGEAIEVAEEAAAAAMRLSPRLSPRMKRDLYDFDDDKHKSKPHYLEDVVRLELQAEMGLGRSLLRSKAASALTPFHHPGSASMLVEAALDAAERDICCIAKDSPDLSHPSYRVSSPHQDYYAAEREPVREPVPSSVASSPRYPPEPLPLIHSLDGYGLPPSVSPSRMYDVHHHHQLITQGSASSDDEGCSGVESDCNPGEGSAQNLSLNLKEKSNDHVDLAPMYGLQDVPGRSPYQEHVALPLQSDLNFSAAMVASPPRYHMYDLSNDGQQTVDLSVASRPDSSPAGDYSYSVDLSLPRSQTPPSLVSSSGHLLLPSPPAYNPPAHLTHPGPSYSPVPPYSPHPVAFQAPPLQRPQISSSSNSPSPGATQYHSYTGYYSM